MIFPTSRRDIIKYARTQSIDSWMPKKWINTSIPTHHWASLSPKYFDQNSAYIFLPIHAMPISGAPRPTSELQPNKSIFYDPFLMIMGEKTSIH